MTVWSCSEPQGWSSPIFHPTNKSPAVMVAVVTQTQLGYSNWLKPPRFTGRLFQGGEGFIVTKKVLLYTELISTSGNFACWFKFCPSGWYPAALQIFGRVNMQHGGIFFSGFTIPLLTLNDCQLAFFWLELFWMATSFCNVSLKCEIQKYEPYFRC